jgi:CorA-like Mg2+ transporter protein
VEQFLAAVADCWVIESEPSAGKLGLLLFREVACTYSRARRVMYSWLEMWDLDFHRRDVHTEPQTLRDLHLLVAEFHRRLNYLCEARYLVGGVGWFPDTLGTSLDEQLDSMVDRATEGLVALAKMLRSAADLLTTAGIREQLRLSKEQSHRGDRLQESFGVVTSVLLVPTFFAGVFGANTAVPGQGHWSGFVLMLVLMLVGGSGTYALFRRLKTAWGPAPRPLVTPGDLLTRDAVVVAVKPGPVTRLSAVQRRRTVRSRRGAVRVVARAAGRLRADGRGAPSLGGAVARRSPKPHPGRPGALFGGGDQGVSRDRSRLEDVRPCHTGLGRQYRVVSPVRKHDVGQQTAVPVPEGLARVGVQAHLSPGECAFGERRRLRSPALHGARRVAGLSSCFVDLNGAREAFRCNAEHCTDEVDHVASSSLGSTVTARPVTIAQTDRPRCRVKRQAELLAQMAGGSLTYFDTSTEQTFRQVYETPLYQQRGLIAATARHEMPGAPQRAPLIFSMTRAGGRQRMLVIRDVAGENLEDPTADPNMLSFFRNADGVFFLFDPMRVEQIRQQLAGVVPEPKAVGGDPYTVLSNLVRLMRDGNRPIRTPLAVVLAKFDTLAELRHVTGSPWAPVLRNAGAAYSRDPSLDAPGYDSDDGELLDAEISSMLVRLDARQMLYLVANEFQTARSFAVSALGAAPSGPDLHPRGIAPFRCLDPLKWVLSRSSQ